MAADRRAEILQVAQDEFSKRGYLATSVQRIASRVGLTKTAVLYHFPEKSDLMQALAAPLLDALEQLVRRATQLAPAQARWAVVEGVLDLNLTHRELLRMNLQDLALSAATFARYRDAMLLANDLVAGPKPTFAARVRASQALAALGDPVVLFFDASTDALRDEVLRGARLLLEDRPALLRRRGRKSELDPAAVERARRWYAKGVSVDEIARRLGVSRATAYRHI
jgi:AcrR family transcriptional regulator